MEYLTIGPGAMGFFALIGHLKTIESELSNVKEIAGSSAGAIIAFLLALDMSITSIIDISLRLDISELVKVDLKCFLEKFGLVDSKVLRNKLVEICGCDPTFSELKKKIHISAFCVNTSKTVYFSVDSNPDMRVLDAVCMSIAVPYIFSSENYNGLTYIDGGSEECLPLAPFLDKPPHKVYCVEIRSHTNYIENIDNQLILAQTLILAGMKNRYRYPLTFQTVKTIDTQDMNIFDFNMEYDDKVRMLILGMK